MSVVYSTKLRVKAARAVLDARDFDDQKQALNHWGVFHSSTLPAPFDDSDEVEYVDRMFDHLKWEVTSWYLTYLEARIEALEGSDSRLPDHR